MYRLWLPCVVGLVFGMWVGGIQGWKRSVELPDVMGGQGSNGSLLVGLTLIRSAAAKGAVCLDGSLPGYHLHIGHGTGKHSWLVALEGGGMCNDTSSCVARATTKFGSSKYMARAIAFTGILSGRPEENPDFYNWNRVKVRYCDGASFSGEGYDKAHGLFFRGQRIWSAVVQELMSRGMRHADQALLSGCSAGGWAAIVHCDEFRAWFSSSTRVKCLSDAGFFVDIADISGKHTMRSLIERVVTLQGVAQNLPRTCTSLMDATSCFFPQYIINQIHTPLFILNSAYDKVQINLSVAPASADPYGFWSACKKNHAHCNADEMTVLQGLRNQVLKAVGSFSMSRQNGLFINSCFTHCQSESQTTWFAENSPALGNTRIAVAVGDWFFDRSAFKARDCAYPCDKTCHHSN